MIAFVKGRLVEKNPTYVIIETNGIGYHLNISLNTYSSLPAEEECKLFTEFVVREDAQILYGFQSQAERELFRLLVSVSGVGPSTAMMVLSAGHASEIQEAIIGGDVAWFKSVKGIGPKSAQRIIIDLKDKVGKVEAGEDILPFEGNTTKEEALSALVMLGFNKNQAEKVVSKHLRKQPNLSVEDVIKYALKGL
jgi:Holliday junction DNA helicase RuvA